MRKRYLAVLLLIVVSLVRTAILNAQSNILVNNNNGATTTGYFTQSISGIVAYGNHVVIAFQDAGSLSGGEHKFTGFAYSSDGGASFTDGGTLPTSENGDGGIPVMARNNTTGRIYLAGDRYTVDGIQVYHSDDDGVTWSSPVNGTPSGVSSVDVEDFPWIAVDNFSGNGNGNVYLASNLFPFGAGGVIQVFRSTDHGATFSQSGDTYLSNYYGSAQGPCIIVGPDHAVYVFWYETGSIKMRKSTDLGQHFSPETIVVSGLIGDQIINGNLGLTGIRQGTTTADAFRTNEFPQVAINPINGQIYVVYDNKGTGADKADVFFIMSANGGSSWSSPKKVNDDASISDQWQPTIAAMPDGLHLGIFYYSRQEDAANNLFKYYGRIAAINGSTITFGASAPVTNATLNPEFGRDVVANSNYMSFHDQATATENGFYVGWFDSRSDLAGGTPRKDPNIYFSFIAQASTPLCPSNPGNTLASADLVCAGTDFTLSLSFDQYGFSYQWQSSPDGTTWTNINGATNSTLTTSTSIGTTYFRCNVTCPNSNTTVASNPKQVTVYKCCTENFDHVVAPALPSGWVASIAAGPGPSWVTSNGGGLPLPAASSFPNSIFVNDPNVISDRRIETPTIAISSGGGTKQISFKNNYSFEFGFDGGILEISINGGAYQDITSAGGVFISGGYNAIINGGFGNPIAGRPAWTGESGGFITTIANLPVSTSGQNVKFRFRMGSDNTIAGNGWRVDDVSIIGNDCGCSATPNPGNTQSNLNPVCPGTEIKLSLQNNTTPGFGQGQTYQWQSSPDGNNWNNINGGRDSVLTTVEVLASYYRCNVTCINSGLIGSSNPILVNTKNCCDQMYEGFDAVTPPSLPAGWSATNASGNAPMWITTNSAAVSLPNSIFIDDPSTISDKIIETPNVVISSASVTKQISFRQNYDLESSGGNYYDGGVLEISINNGSYQDVISAGGNFVAGGYNGTISSSFSNPLAGRQAWSGNSGGFIATTINLPASASGQQVKFRFRMGSDNSNSKTGWWIDNIKITGLECSETTSSITFDNCTSGTTDLGCNPQTIPGCNQNITATTTCNGGATVNCSIQDSGPDCAKVRTITYTATDGCGNTATCIQTFTWKIDHTAPVIGIPGVNATINCTETPSFTPPTATDNCGNAVVELVSDEVVSGSCGGYRRTKTWRAKDGCNNYSDPVSQTITVNCSCTEVVNCSYGQGFFGNAGGTGCNGQNNYNTSALLDQLLGINPGPQNPVVVGRTGHSIIVPSTIAGRDKLMNILPAGGTPKALKVGNCVITDACINNYLKNGKLNNNLIGQTITLSLNLRLNAGSLEKIPIQSGWLNTQIRTNCGSSAEIVSCADNINSIQSYQMNTAVAIYLNAIGDATVSGLLDLCNDVLGGAKNPGSGNPVVPSFSDIVDAANTINNAFDGCRSFLGYTTCQASCADPLGNCLLTRGPDASEKNEVTQKLTVFAYPNPYNETVKFVIQSPVSGQASLEVYNLQGQKVLTIYKGLIIAGRAETISFDVPNAKRTSFIYIFRVNDQRVSGKLLHLERN